jgi:queuine tRNA-ribosyltransferase
MSAFKILTKDSNSHARNGILQTEHGEIETPVFMPVGTSGAVKGIRPCHLEEIGSSIILANTYHLLLRPGVDVIEKIGGLHKLMGWNRPILTDSGGYQVFSLNCLTKINDEGVEFASHVDGKKFTLNAETATEIQNRLGADIIMCFDQCTEHPCEQEELEKAVERSIKWAERCKKAQKNKKQLLFGIVQGGINLDLRRKCTEELLKLNFDGYAIGGLSVGEGHENMVKTAAYTSPLLPEEKPRYLMGVGMPDEMPSLLQIMDLFACETANTLKILIRLRKVVTEMLGPILLSIHNLRFFQRLAQKIREKISEDAFGFWADEKIEQYLRLYS